MNKNRKKPNRYKVTADVYKQIKQIAEELGPFHRRDKLGNLMYKAASKTVLGEDLPEGALVEGKKPVSGKLYVQHYRQPILVNHEVELVEIYQQDGQKGIDIYVKFFKDMLEEAAKIKEAKSAGLKVVHKQEDISEEEYLRKKMEMKTKVENLKKENAAS